MTFNNQIIVQLEQKGAIYVSILFESPFTNVKELKLLGVFDKAASIRIIQLIERSIGMQQQAKIITAINILLSVG
jgi:hypothetical protein